MSPNDALREARYFTTDVLSQWKLVAAAEDFLQVVTKEERWF